MSRYKTVLFDLDGTLADTYEIILACFHHSLGEVLGKDFPDEKLMGKVGQPLEVQMRDYSDKPEELSALLASYRAYNDKIHDELITLFPGVAEGIPALVRAGYTLGIVTSKRKKAAVHGLKLLGIHDYFDVIIAADDTDEHKPSAKPVLCALESLGADAVNTVFVGDSPFDVQAGTGAGVDTVAVTWGMFDIDILKDQKPTYMVDSFEELANILEQA